MRSNQSKHFFHSGWYTCMAVWLLWCTMIRRLLIDNQISSKNSCKQIVVYHSELAVLRCFASTFKNITAVLFFFFFVFDFTCVGYIWSLFWSLISEFALAYWAVLRNIYLFKLLGMLSQTQNLKTTFFHCCTAYIGTDSCKFHGTWPHVLFPQLTIRLWE